MQSFLIQRKTGRVYVRTDAYAARGDMDPYTFPAEPALKETEGVPPYPQDIFDNLTKAELETYAMDRFGVNLDKRKSLQSLIDEVKSLESTKNLGDI